MAVSLFPLAALSLGMIVFAKFEVALLPFDSRKLNMTYQIYSVGNMYTILYNWRSNLVNSLILSTKCISSTIGYEKAIYFLFTREYWCNTPEISFMDETLKKFSNYI